MAIKVGTTTASLYLGSTPVAAYLGGEQVYSAVQAVTLYFYYDRDDEEASSDWTTVGNWWLDDAYTEPAGRLPTSADSVVVSNRAFDADGQTVVNLTVDGDEEGLRGSLVVTGLATFNSRAFNEGTVTGNATFNDDSVNFGTVTGTATFNDSACNDGGTAGTFVPDPPPACS